MLNPSIKESRKLKALYIAAALVLSLCVSDIVVAEIYKWVDANGQVHFTDKKPRNQKTKTIEVKDNSYNAVSHGTSSYNTGGGVIMYATKWCPYCKKARQYFKKNKIRYTEYDIEKDYRAKKRYDKMGASGVPVILVGKKRMNGFSEASFKRIYK